MELTINNINVQFDGKNVLTSISHEFTPGVYGVLGKNGAGKSTLLNAIRNKSGFQWNGEIRFNKNKLDEQFIKDNISYLPQTNSGDSVLTVKQTLLMGLYNELKWRITREQHLRINEAIDKLETQLGVDNIAQKKLNELSGGQRQLVLLAQCLIKRPKILLLDEPCTHLDIRNQIIFINRMKELEDMIIISTMHEINLAVQHVDTILLLNDGNIAYSGHRQNIDPDILQKVYGVKTILIEQNDIRDFAFTDVL
ncbi:ABC transporter ATP-binding protein [Photobacterium leiognathi]|uniref:ABC transporter ATP-binding protein n=1 Tax=Photobacterium leiognathi TaxID=553611 RepID=UPI0029816022|nr:ABC transporter ATP-binding protein [Photobacterium leiognathi]